MTDRKIKTCGIIVCAIQLVVLRPTVAAQEVSADLTLTSDYVFRGVSQTMSSPALQGTVVVEDDTGLYGFVWASNVDFTSGNDPDDGARSEVNIELGYFHELTERVAINMAWTRYFYPGTEQGADYDYDEWLATLYIDESHHLNVAYADSVFNSGFPGVTYSAGSEYEFAQSLGVGVDLGYSDLDRAYDISYGFAELALFGEWHDVNWRLSHFSTESVASDVFYTSNIEDRVVLALRFDF